MNKTTQAKHFWEWFVANQASYKSFPEEAPEKQQELEDIFLNHLHAYCEGLFFEIDIEDTACALTITAEGDADLFPEVSELVSSAPDLPGWTIHNLRQPLGDVISEYEDLIFDPDDTIFIPLVNEEDPFAVGIEVCYDEYSKDRHEDWLIGTFMMLDTVIGEQSTALDIDYVAVKKTPKDIEKLEYHYISDIGEYIAEVKGRKPMD